MATATRKSRKTTVEAVTEPMTEDGVVRKNLSLVHYAARRIIRTTRTDTGLDELVSAGTVGLMEAVGKYDPSRGVAFSTFALPRIRGAIMDDLRRRDHVPRSVRRKEREIAQARERLTGNLGRRPTRGELAAEIGIPLRKLWQWQRDIQCRLRISLDAPVRADGETETRLGETLAGGEAGEVEAEFASQEAAAMLSREVLGLPEPQRAVLSLCYFHGMKLREAGEIMGVCESRICQIRRRALLALRERLGALR